MGSEFVLIDAEALDNPLLISIITKEIERFFSGHLLNSTLIKE